MDRMKVALNVTAGAFSLSREAFLMGKTLAKDPLWGGADPGEAKYGYGAKIPRHDPVLIAVIEQMGRAANGPYSTIGIVEIDRDRYVVLKRDGIETAMGVNDFKWVDPKPLPEGPECDFCDYRGRDACQTYEESLKKCP